MAPQPTRQALEAIGLKPSSAVKTYRYLRLAMVGVVLGLAGSIAFEFHKLGGECLQHSISAYYYTPVRGFFVGGLLAIAVCLICLRGNTDGEDAFLNFAGMCAPIVAFVPTASAGDCTSTPAVIGQLDLRGVDEVTASNITQTAKDIAQAATRANIVNNVEALFVLGAASVVALACFIAWGHRTKKDPPTRSAKLSFAAACVILVGAAIVFYTHQDLFARNAHYTAAVAMFVFIWFAVIANALDFKKQKPTATAWNRYTPVAVFMPVAALAVFAAGMAGWQHAVFGIEALLIGAFAAIWLVQTQELWDFADREQAAQAEQQLAVPLDM